MSKKRITLSFISMFLSILAFGVVTFAWFVSSSKVNQTPFDLLVSPGIFTDYEVHYYTQENVFRLSDSYIAYKPISTSIEKYDTSSETWVTPTYSSGDDIGSFDGILMKQFDPVIEANNFYNNLIIEIYFTYDLTQSTSLSVMALIDSTLAGTLPVDLDDPDPHYLSEALDIQHTSFDGITDYAYGVGGRTETTNLYESLTSLFDDGTYPKTDFGNPLTDIAFEDMVLSGSGSRYVYFNFSYNVDNVTAIVSDRALVDTYYFDINNNIVYIDHLLDDTIIYTYDEGLDVFTAYGNEYTIEDDDENGRYNLLNESLTIVIYEEDLYPNEDDAHGFTDFIHFYKDIRLSISW
ncbi:MAG: hypothetical protein KAU02_03410 [Tenericutes bacterium]|nr:hypothetical protein [Mycoplasmatota bacterium]